MFKKFYYYLHRKINASKGGDVPSAGVWAEEARVEAIKLCGSFKGRFLEVGCGEGLFLSKAASGSSEKGLFGIDLARQKLLMAKERFKQEGINNVFLVQSSANLLPIKKEFFDIIVCVNVFLNLPSEKMLCESLDEIIRVCKSQGRIIFDIRNSKNPLLYFKYKLAKYYDATVRELHLRTYNIDRIIAYLKEHNCEVKNMSFIGWPKNYFAPIFLVEAVKK